MTQTKFFVLFAVLLVSFVGASAGADEKIYRITKNADHKPGIQFHLPYSMGMHDGEALEVTGAVTLDPANPSSAKGGFKVPIKSLKTGNKSRDCHLLESMGLDYTKSKYPADHVCNGDDQIPNDPANAIIYPEIEFKLKSVQMADGKLSAINGEWLIRDASTPISIPLKVTPDGDGFHVKGTCPVSLSAHHIVVKSAKVLFVTISVEDTATVDLDLHFEPVSGATTP